MCTVFSVYSNGVRNLLCLSLWLHFKIRQMKFLKTDMALIVSLNKGIEFSF